MPKPIDELLAVVESETGLAKTPAVLTALPEESSTEPVIVLEVPERIKFLPVILAANTFTSNEAGGIKLNVGGGGGGAPGAINEDGIAGPTPT